MSTDFYEALDRARQDPASATPELAKLAEALKPGGKLYITRGDQQTTPEELARIINLTFDEIKSGKIKGYATFEEAEAAGRQRVEQFLGVAAIDG